MNTDDVCMGGAFIGGTLLTAAALGCLGPIIVAGVAAVGAKHWVKTAVPAMSKRVYEHKEEALWKEYNSLSADDHMTKGKEIKGQIDAIKRMKSANDNGIEQMSNLAALGTFAYPPAALGIALAAIDNTDRPKQPENKQSNNSLNAIEANFLARLNSLAEEGKASNNELRL